MCHWFWQMKCLVACVETQLHFQAWGHKRTQIRTNVIHKLHKVHKCSPRHGSAYFPSALCCYSLKRDLWRKAQRGEFHGMNSGYASERAIAPFVHLLHIAGACIMFTPKRQDENGFDIPRRKVHWWRPNAAHADQPLHSLIHKKRLVQTSKNL